MQFLRVGILIAFAISQFTILPVTHAASSGVVISHVIAGETNFSNSELVAVYNNSSSDIDMTGYCLWSSSFQTAGVACIQAEANTKVYIRAHGFLTIASSSFVSNHSGYTPDTVYAAANRITVGGDSVYIKDSAQNEIDRVTWGANKLTTGGTLQRKETAVGSGVLVDTDAIDPLVDFSAAGTLIYPANASYDVVTVVDICPNLTGVQQTMPSGYLADETGQCQVDSCVNLAGLQVNVPDHYDSDVSGNCMQRDECANVAGTQTEIPTHMIRGDTNDCIWDITPLELTELLPNAMGSDTGNEYIEIFNPSAKVVDLSLYSIRTGINGDKVYAFPEGVTIAPGEYRAFNDTTMKFTLVNTSGRVMLEAIDGSVLGDSGNYDSPSDGMSWALIENTWQYTNQPTPAAANLSSLPEELESTETANIPAPCPVGKYRNPLTNRCRNIDTDTSVLAMCDADQYRNPDTGRCRKLSVTTITPCKDGQYRSEETNRCRNISTASTAKPCKDNQYRSEETGRCRNLTGTSVPDSAFAVQPVKDGAMAFVGWWALGGVGLLAAGYAGWEWRQEMAASFVKVAGFFSGRK